MGHPGLRCLADVRERSRKKFHHPEQKVLSKEFYAQESQLSQWPVQIKLVPISAPYFDDANLLVAADCTAYAYGNFHQKFIKIKLH